MGIKDNVHVQEYGTGLLFEEDIDHVFGIDIQPFGANSRAHTVYEVIYA